MAMAETTVAAPDSPPSSGKRRNPRLDQYKRTWYFLRRNTLALIGLGVILFFIAVAIFATTQPIPYYALTKYCATNQTNPNTYTSFTPAIPIALATNGLANGTYSFQVSAVKGLTATPASGSFQVSGAPRVVTINFTVTPITTLPSGPSGLTSALAHSDAGPPYYSVTFIENGLPGSVLGLQGWSVTTNDTTAPGCIAGFPAVCTYPSGSSPPGPNCYQTPQASPSVIGPTLTARPLSIGPLPLGALTLSAGSPYFFNTAEGLLRGSDWSLLISFSIVVLGALIGLLLGAISGFFGGVVDETLMRLVDIFLSIPQILFVIVVVAVVSTSFQTIGGLDVPDTKIFLLIIAFLVTWWPFYARVVRGQVLVVREQKYVEAARASGSGKGRIVLKHIVPNSVYPVFIQMSLDVGTIPLFLGSLVFLGFLIFPSLDFPEWGSIAALSVNDLQGFLVTCQVAGGCVIPWWQIAFPGLVLFMFAISVNFLSDGLRDALDPRLRR